MYLSLSLSLPLYLSLSLSFFGQVMSPGHSDQMCQRSQVSRIAPWRGSLNVFVFVIVFVFVFVFFGQLCLLIILIKEREWTSLLSKALSLSINCNILKLFPQGSCHRSHHTQKVVPNVVARHQLLNTSPDNGIFPIKDMSRLMRKISSLFSKYQNRFIH